MDPVLGSFKSWEIEKRPYPRGVNGSARGSAHEASGASEVVYLRGEMIWAVSLSRVTTNLI